MEQKNVVSLEKQVAASSRSALDELLRQGAQRMLQTAIETEVSAYVEEHQGKVSENGRRLVVRNGHLPERPLQTGLGAVRIEQPRVDDRRAGQKFTSRILPPYLRRVPSLDALIPALYLHGISTGDFTEALAAILGPGAAGLSPANIVRLKAGWEQEFQQWQERDLNDKHYVYWWADGVHFNVRLTEDRPCILVIMGSLENGTNPTSAIRFRKSRFSGALVSQVIDTVAPGF